MGITSLLPFLEKSTRNTDIQDLKGSRAAIDAYCLLHKGATACAQDLVMGKPNNQYLEYVMKYVHMLLRNRIIPIMVFDGMRLPAKQLTEMKRQEQRTSSRKEAIECLRLGKLEEARKYFVRCVDINHGMASKVIEACREVRVDCIVAPYEADSQLAYLNRSGLVDFVISEDSDLMLFGCEKVLYKLNLNGTGRMVMANSIATSMGMSEEKYTFEKFLYMCIMSGCDYLSSLPGIGLKKALKFFKTTAEEDPAKFLGKIPNYLNMRHLNITDSYKRDFLMAVATFRHQVIFDVQTQTLGRLNPIEDPKFEEFCGNAGQLKIKVDPRELAIGNYDPCTLKKINNFTIDLYQSKASIWNRDYVTKQFKRVIESSSNKLADVSKPRPRIISPPNETNFEMEAQYDAEFQQELKIYDIRNGSSISQVPEPAEIEDKKDLMEVDGRISPVLNYNPFRKINNSLLNSTSREKVIESRHFSRNLVKSRSLPAVISNPNDQDENINPVNFLVVEIREKEDIIPVVEPSKDIIIPRPLQPIANDYVVYEPPKKKAKTMRQTSLNDFFKRGNGA